MRRMFTALSLVLVGVIGCGTADATAPGNPNVFPAGGTVQLAGGRVYLVVPAGAVAEPIEVTATAVSNPSAGLVVRGTVFELASKGRFTKPVQVVIPYLNDSIPATVRPSELSLYRLRSEFFWSSIPGAQVLPISNIVSASVDTLGTFGAVGSAVASVTVSPAGILALTVATTVQLAAVAKAGDATPLPDRGIAWTSASPAIATVSSTGVVTGNSPGTAEIRATTEGVQGTSMVTVVAAGTPQAGAHPNEPVGFTMVKDINFNTTALGAGWVYSSKWLDTAYTRVVQDTFLSATRGTPPNVVEHVFPIGFTDATQPPIAGLFYSGKRAMYVSYWIKVSNPWQYHPSGVNKLFFIATNGSTNLDNEMVCGLVGSSAATAQYVCGVQTPQNAGMAGVGAGGYYVANIAQPGLSLGVWHHIEIHAARSTGGLSNGLIEWWVDGNLTGRHTTVLFNSTSDALFDGFHINPNWGGSSNATKNQRDFIRLDDWYVSILP